jgi:pimeloyl-ACP methyl ester carboxylesterase
VRLANSRIVLLATVAATRFFGRYSTRLGGAIAYWLWFVPWRVPVSDRALQKQTGWLQPTRPFALRTTVGRIAGFIAGEGPTVFLVHGLGERGASLGRFIAPLTGAGFKVVGVDLPGHGRSSGQTTNPIAMAAALREVADHFGGAHAVIAHSLGASGALWAINAGLAVERAVLIAPTVDVGSAMDMFEALFGLPPKAIAGLRRKIERRYGPNIWQDLSAERLVANVETPGLVFHDPDDPQVPFAGSQRLVGAWRSSMLITTPGLGHGAITRDPSVVERVVAFLAQPTGQLTDATTEAVRRG